MTESLNIYSKQRMCSALTEALQIIQNIPVKRECISCEHWNTDGCRLAGGKMPPKEIKENGCESWSEGDYIPY